MAGQHNSADQAQAALTARWPGWDIWYVPLALAGFTWCARPAGTRAEPCPGQLPE
jgi:hypothetical protein